MKLTIYKVITVVCKLALYASFLVTAFMVSKPLGLVVAGITAVGFIVDELKYREQVKLEEKAAAEFMQLLASKTGQGSC